MAPAAPRAMVIAHRPTAPRAGPRLRCPTRAAQARAFQQWPLRGQPSGHPTSRPESAPGSAWRGEGVARWRKILPSPARISPPAGGEGGAGRLLVACEAESSNAASVGDSGEDAHARREEESGLGCSPRAATAARSTGISPVDSAETGTTGELCARALALMKATMNGSATQMTDEPRSYRIGSASLLNRLVNLGVSDEAKPSPRDPNHSPGNPFPRTGGLHLFSGLWCGRLRIPQRRRFRNNRPASTCSTIKEPLCFGTNRAASPTPNHQNRRIIRRIAHLRPIGVSRPQFRFDRATLTSGPRPNPSLAALSWIRRPRRRALPTCRQARPGRLNNRNRRKPGTPGASCNPVNHLGRQFRCVLPNKVRRTSTRPFPIC